MSQQKEAVIIDVEQSSPGETSPGGSTDLYDACMRGDHDTVTLLLAATGQTGLNHEVGAARWSPLAAAAHGGHTAIVTALLDASADLHHRCARGFSVLDKAAQAGSVDVVRVLLAAKVDPSGAQAASIDLSLEVKSRSQEGSDLLRSSVARNVLGTGGPGPLSLAAEAGHLHVVRLLLEAQADPDGSTQTLALGDTALMVATTHGHTAVVEALLQAGANTEVRDKTVGCTPLMWACVGGQVATAALLLNYKAEVNARSARQATPLHIAVYFRKGGSQLVKLLLESAADPSLTNAEGHTALTLAKRHKRRVAAARLRSRSGRQTPVSGTSITDESVSASFIDDDHSSRASAFSLSGSSEPPTPASNSSAHSRGRSFSLHAVKAAYAALSGPAPDSFVAPRAPQEVHQPNLVIWEQYVDPHRNKPYYFCPSTGQTVWRKPRGVKIVEVETLPGRHAT